jgi:hypothetical protein
MGDGYWRPQRVDGGKRTTRAGAGPASVLIVMVRPGEYNVARKFTEAVVLSGEIEAQPGRPKPSGLLIEVGLGERM